MAIWKVDSNGSAPKDAKSGDTIVTAGGSYQVLDSAKYKGMSSADLAKQGVAYNPSSGLYSKKVSTMTPNNVSLMRTTPLYNWKDQANKNALSQLDASYRSNKASVDKAYNNSKANYENQKGDISQAYVNNREELYKDTYLNNAVAMENATNRGMTSAGVGNAMSLSGLMNASNVNTQLRGQRDTDVNKVNTLINALTKDYDIDLNMLQQKLSDDKAGALSGNESKFIEALMDLDKYNTDAYNTALLAKNEQSWKSSEAQKDRDAAKEQLLLSLRNSGGGGGYGRYSKKGGSGEPSSANQKEYDYAESYFNSYMDRLNENQKVQAKHYLLRVYYGDMSYADYKAKVQGFLNSGKTTKETAKDSLVNKIINNSKNTPASNYTRVGRTYVKKN